MTNQLMTNQPKTAKEIYDLLSKSELIQIVKDYDLFEEQGFIGDCLLRTSVTELHPTGTSFHLIAVGLVMHAQRKLLKVCGIL